MKNILQIIVIFHISISFSQVSYFQDWVQLGNVLNGVTNNSFGKSSAINGIGNTIIVGGDIFAKVFQFNGSNWIQKGLTISGAGYAVDISQDGNTIAISDPTDYGSFLNAGTVRIYSWTGTSWVQKGLDIDGEGIGNWSGWSISLSDDGNLISIGAYGNNGNGSQSGHARIFMWNGSNWTQKGQDINGEAAGDFFGFSVSLSADGNTVGVGAINNDGNGNDSGHTRIFYWNGTNWIQKGQDIDGPMANAFSGTDVCLNATGSIIVIGEHGTSNPGVNNGMVRCFEWTGSNWTQKGQNIIGLQNNDYLGFSVDMSHGGDTIALSAPGNNGDTGLVQIYTWNGNAWIQLGSSLYGGGNSYSFGNCLDLNFDGTKIICGSPSSNVNGIYSGQVDIFKICNNVATIDAHSACNNYTWIDGITYTANNNSAVYTLPKVDGCDSIITLNLTIYNNTAGTQSITACDNYTWINGVTYLSSTNSPTYTLQNVNGCDSIVNLNLTITQINNSISQYICGGPFIWNNQSYGTSGTYSQIFQAANGCDSIVTLNLTILNNNFNSNFNSNQQLFTSPPFAVQFSNTTPNPINYTFTWYWGDGTSTTSNNATVFHQYLNNGLYTVTLEAINNTTGCIDDTTLTDYIFTTGGVSCIHSASISQSGPINGCSGQPIVLSCNSNPSFTYQWRRNGIYIQGNNNDTLLVNQSGTYTVIISVNGCPVSSSPVTVNIANITPPTISSSGTIQPCLGGSVTLTVSSGFTNYLWSNGSTSQSISVASSGNYSVQGTGSNGCVTTSASYTVNASFIPTQNICVVGVDSLTNNIRVVWEEPLTTAIDSFLIYKESNVSNVYTQLGSRAYDSLSVWIDPFSNPAVQAYRYKITALDTCGVETPFSDFHKTIHLTINQGVGGVWNLIWSHYEGINFGSYNIYRGTLSSNMTLLTTIQSNLNSYSDLTPPLGNVYYQVEIVNPNTCTPTKSTNYSSSKSNVVTNNQGSINELTQEVMRIYPNPTDSKLKIEISNGLIGKEYSITDFSGRELRRSIFNFIQETIELNSFSNGVYFIQVRGSNIQEKIIKQ